MDVSRFYRILPGITGFGMDFAKFFLKIILSFFKQSLQASCGIRIGFFLKVQVGGGRTPMDVTLNTERGEGQKSQPEATWKREGSGGPYRVSLPSCFLFFCLVAQSSNASTGPSSFLFVVVVVVFWEV